MIRTIRSLADDAAPTLLWAVLAAVLVENLGKPAGECLRKKKDSMANARKRKRVARLRGYAAAVERVRAASAGEAMAYLLPRWIAILLLYIVSLFAAMVGVFALFSGRPGTEAGAAAMGGVAIFMFVMAARHTERGGKFCRAVYSPASYSKFIEEPLRKLGALPEAGSAETAQSEPGSAGTGRTTVARQRFMVAQFESRAEGTVPKPVRLATQPLPPCVACGQDFRDFQDRRQPQPGFNQPACPACGLATRRHITTLPGKGERYARHRRSATGQIRPLEVPIGG